MPTAPPPSPPTYRTPTTRSLARISVPLILPPTNHPPPTPSHPHFTSCTNPNPPTTLYSHLHPSSHSTISTITPLSLSPFFPLYPPTPLPLISSTPPQTPNPHQAPLFTPTINFFNFTSPSVNIYFNPYPPPSCIPLQPRSKGPPTPRLCRWLAKQDRRIGRDSQRGFALQIVKAFIH